MSREELEPFLLKIAERKNYLKSVKVEPSEGSKFYLWEMRNIDKLVKFADIREVANTRRTRNHISKKIDFLVKLIKTIETSKKLEDISKINKAFDNYTSLKNSSPKLIPPPKDKTTGKKKSMRRKQDEVEGIDNEKPSPQDILSSTPKENEISVSELVTPLNSPKKQSTKRSSKKPVNDDAKENLNKSNKKEIPAKKDDSSQKKLFSFFSKKDLVEASTNDELYKNPHIDGSSDASMNQVWDHLFSSKQICLQSIIQSMGKMNFKRKSNPRYVFIYISDSMNPTKITQVKEEAKEISGRRPFVKEESLDYELDSEDEYEEKCCGEDLNSEISVEEEDSEVDSEEDFIVPDGYLSDIEKADSENGDCAKEKVTNFNLNRPTNLDQCFLIDLRNHSPGVDSTIDQFLSNFEFVSLVEGNQIDIKPPKADPKINPLLNDMELQRELVRGIHGGFDKKFEIINHFSIL